MRCFFITFIANISPVHRCCTCTRRSVRGPGGRRVYGRVVKGDASVENYSGEKGGTWRKRVGTGATRVASTAQSRVTAPLCAAPGRPCQRRPAPPLAAARSLPAPPCPPSPPLPPPPPPLSRPSHHCPYRPPILLLPRPLPPLSHPPPSQHPTSHVRRPSSATPSIARTATFPSATVAQCRARPATSGGCWIARRSAAV
ncbi:unnamed protein product [Closterium sp. NIES-53]